MMVWCPELEDDASLIRYASIIVERAIRDARARGTDEDNETADNLDRAQDALAVLAWRADASNTTKQKQRG